MSSDALDRIRQRQRPKVTPRDASLTSQSPDIPMSGPTDFEEFPDIQTQAGSSKASKSSDIQTSRHADIEDIRGSVDTPHPLDTSASRHTDIKTHQLQDNELQTKRSTFRLEAKLIDRLHTFCRRQGLSREVLIEAMYEYMESHPDALEQVVAAATEKNEYRQQLANRKRAEAMMSKFGGQL